MVKLKRSKTKPKVYRGRRQAKRAPEPKKVGGPIPELVSIAETEGLRFLCRIDQNEVEEIYLTSEGGYKLRANRWECPSCGHVWLRHQLVERAINTEGDG